MTEAELADRLERLERDNRRLKRLATIALVIAAALGAIYAARPVPDKITAHEFDVVDNAGRARVKIAIDYQKQSDGQTADAPNVTLYDANGAEREELGGYYGPSLMMFDDNGNPAVDLCDTFNSPSLSLTGGRGGGPSPLAKIFTKVDKPLPPSPGVIISDADSGPTIILADPQGFSTDLGSTSTVTIKTGETHETSAASIVMFGNDKNHHVIWQAP